MKNKNKAYSGIHPQNKGTNEKTSICWAANMLEAGGEEENDSNFPFWVVHLKEPNLLKFGQ